MLWFNFVFYATTVTSSIRAIEGLRGSARMLCWKITRAANSGYRRNFIGLAYWPHITALTGELDVGIFAF